MSAEVFYRIVSAEYVTSVHSASDLLESELPEVAFVGRSNSGKSTLLNALCGQNALARVSKTPGRTQALNFFKVRFVKEHRDPASGKSERLDSFDVHFVDLPGYGYAAVNKSVQRNWTELLDTYLGERKNLQVVVSLCDSRRGLKEEERWFFEIGIPAEIFLVLSKTDKLSKSELNKVRDATSKELGISTNAIFSTALISKKKEGVESLCQAIGKQVDPSV